MALAQPLYTSTSYFVSQYKPIYTGKTPACPEGLGGVLYSPCSTAAVNPTARSSTVAKTVYILDLQQKKLFHHTFSVWFIIYY